MTKQTHTPGPWEVENNPSTSFFINTKAHGIKEYSPEFCNMYEGNHAIAKTFGNNSKANAQLIAAAPELLEACKDMLIAFNMKVYCLDPKDLDLIDQLSNAVWKAEEKE